MRLFWKCSDDNNTLEICLSGSNEVACVGQEKMSNANICRETVVQVSFACTQSTTGGFTPRLATPHGTRPATVTCFEQSWRADHGTRGDAPPRDQFLTALLQSLLSPVQRFRRQSPHHLSPSFLNLLQPASTSPFQLLSTPIQLPDQVFRIDTGSTISTELEKSRQVTFSDLVVASGRVVSLQQDRPTDLIFNLHTTYRPPPPTT